jgi:hypothetical protein
MIRLQEFTQDREYSAGLQNFADSIPPDLEL